MTDEVYATFSGMIDQQSVGQVFRLFDLATQNKVKVGHFLFQSNGGLINDGVALYNFFRALPFELRIYNSGAVQSVATIAYLAGARRIVSRHASFMIHKTSVNPAHPTIPAHRLGSLIEALCADDERIEAILRTHTTIPDDRWALHAQQDVLFKPQEAVDFGIANEIGEFQVPDDTPVYSVWPN